MTSVPATTWGEHWIEPDWPAPPCVRAAVSTRHGPGVSLPPFDRFNLGSRCGDDAQAVEHNRRVLVSTLALPAAPQWLQQVHGTDVLAVDADADVGSAAEPTADAAITTRPGKPLVILTADCLPVLFCAADGSAVGAAHAGWRGLVGGVLENTVAAMRRHAAAGVPLRAWLGPAIAAASYEVGDEVFTRFVASHAGDAACFAATRPGHWLCDLPALAKRRLRDAGVAEIHGGHFDTFSDPRLYSYRRDRAGSGRLASVVWLDRGAIKSP